MEGADAPSPDERRIGEVKTYDDMVGVIRLRVAEKQISLSDLDELAGVPAGYMGKVLGPAQVKKLGPLSMWLVLQALGLAVIVVENREALEAMQDRYVKKNSKQMRPGNHASRVSIHMKARVIGEFARLGNRHRWRKKTKGERSAHASMMARARWIKVRKDRKGRRRWAGNRPKKSGAVVRRKAVRQVGAKQLGHHGGNVRLARGVPLRLAQADAQHAGGRINGQA